MHTHGRRKFSQRPTSPFTNSINAMPLSFPAIASLGMDHNRAKSSLWIMEEIDFDDLPPQNWYCEISCFQVSRTATFWLPYIRLCNDKLTTTECSSAGLICIASMNPASIQNVWICIPLNTTTPFANTRERLQTRISCSICSRLVVFRNWLLFLV